MSLAHGWDVTYFILNILCQVCVYNTLLLLLLLKKTWLKTAQYFIHNSESSPLASRHALKYLNSMVPMVYILIEIKSEILTKRCYWRVFGTWQHHVRSTIAKWFDFSLVIMHHFSACVWKIVSTPQATCEEKEDIRSFKWYRRYGWGWGLPKPPGKTPKISSDSSKSPEYTISLIFFEKT